MAAVKNVNTGSEFGDIQSAVNAADPGDKIELGAGTYDENVVINESVTLVGNGTVVIDGGNTIPGPGIEITSSNVTMKNIEVQGFTQGGWDGPLFFGVHLSASGGTLENITLKEVSSTGNEVGLAVEPSTTVDGLTIKSSHFDNNVKEGFYLRNQEGTDSTVANVLIKGTSFNNNGAKGFYAEKLEKAVLDNIEVIGSGYDSTAYGFGDFLNGIDINLKYGEYNDITINNSLIEDSGHPGTNEPFSGAVVIKARDDGSYQSNPATLTGVEIVDNTFSRTSDEVYALRLGEPGKNNAGPQAVTIEGNTFTGYPTPVWDTTASSGIDLETVVSKNTFSDIPIAYSENITSFTSLQEAIDQADPGDTIPVGSGTYEESVHVDISDLIIQGQGNVLVVGQGPISDPSTPPAEAPFVVSGDSVVIDGLDVESTSTRDTVGITGEAVTWRNSVLKVGDKAGFHITGNGTIKNVKVVDSSGASFDGEGVKVYDALPKTTFKNLTVTDMRHGIHVRDTNDVTVQGSTFTGGSTSGVFFLSRSEDITGSVNGSTFEDSTNALLVHEDNFGDPTPPETDFTFGDVSSNSFANNSPHVIGLRSENGDFDAVATIDTQSIFDLNEFDRAVVVDRPGNSLLPTIWSSVQSAVDESQDGDTVTVLSGSYEEDVFLSSDVDIVGTGSSQPVIEGVWTTDGPDPNDENAFIENVSFRDIVLQNDGRILAFENTEMVRNLVFNRTTIQLSAESTSTKSIVFLELESFGTAGETDIRGSKGLVFEDSTISANGHALSNNHFVWIQAKGGPITFDNVTVDGLDTDANIGTAPENLTVVSSRTQNGGSFYFDGVTGLTVQDSEFRHNGLTLNGVHRGVVEHNTFVDIEQGKVIDVSSDWGSAGRGNVDSVIRNNTFTDIRTDAIVIKTGEDWNPTAEEIPRIIYNDFSGVEKPNDAVRNDFSVTANATHNFWGAPSGPSGAANGFGVSVSENVLVTPFYADQALTTLRTETGLGEVIVVDDDGPSDFDSISTAVQNAGSGAVIEVRSGQYNESGITLDKPLTIDGAGMDATVVDAQNSEQEGSQHAFIVQSNNVTIRDLTMADGHNTIRISSTAEVADFSLLNTRINDSNIGMYVAGANQADNGEFDRVTFRNTRWINNERKGMYLEKLSNALIVDTVVNGVTSDTYGFNNGIDINLKHDDYSNITIRDTVVANVTKGTPFNGDDSFSAAIAIKARDDDGHPNYGPADGTPATLDGVTLDNVTVRDSFNGLRFGEPGATNEEPTNVSITDSRFEGNTGYHIQLATNSLQVGTPGYVESNNTFVGEVVVSDADGPRSPRTVWSNLGDAISFAENGDSVVVEGGRYREDLDVANNLNLTGNGATIDGRVDLQTDGITFQGFTITNSTAEPRVDGIRVSTDGDTSEQVIIKDVTIENLDNKSTTQSVEGIHIFANQPIDGVLIEDVIVQDIRQPAWGADGIKIQAGATNVTIRNATIRNIHGEWSYGVVSTPSSDLSLGVPTNVLIEGSTFRSITSDLDNAGVAVGIDSASGDVTGTGVAPGNETTVHNSSFGSLDYGVVNKDTESVTDATTNYWGAPNGPSGGVTGPDGNIANGDGVAVSERVRFVPFLSQPGGGPASVTTNVSTLDFGDVTVKTDGSNRKTLAIEVTSSGDQPLKLNAFNLLGADRGQFRLTAGDATGTLDPLETRTVKVAFVPTRLGTASATLSIATNAAGQGAVTIDLLGNGRGPNLNVTTAEPVMFEAVVDSTDDQTVTLRNDGNAELSITDASAQSPFSVTNGPTSPLSVGETTDVTVQFQPTASTSALTVGQLTLQTNDTFKPTQQVRLSGTALAANVHPSIPSGTEIDFGTVSKGTTVTIDIILTNNGTDTLSINSVSTTGAAFGASAASTSLAPSESTAISVTVKPSTTGSLSGTLSVTTNARNLNWNLAAAAEARTLSVASFLNFGNTPVGSTKTGVLTISNTGTLPLSVDLRNAFAPGTTQFSLVSGTRQFSIPGSGSRSVTIAFSPTGSGVRSGTMTIKSNDPDKPTATVSLSGTGTQSALTVVGSSSVTFDDVAANQRTTKSITIRNSGDAPISSFAAPTFTGPNAGSFSVVSRPSSLGAQSSGTVVVAFEPGAVGDHRATLTISSSGGGASTSMSLFGTAVPPDIAFNRTSMNFGYVATAGGTSSQAVTISNADTHQTELTIDDVRITGKNSGSFSVTANPSSPIAGGQSSTAVVEFDPATAGRHTASLQFDSNDPDEGTVSVQLNGNGASPQTQRSPSTVAFGDVVYGRSATRTFTVTNVGGVSLVVNDLSVGDAQFSIVGGREPVTLVPGASETYTVSVRPTQQNAISSTVTIDTNANDPAVTVTANPIEPEISPSSGNPISFDDTRIGSASQETLSVSNNGDAVLTVGAPSVSGADSDVFSVVNAPKTAYLGPSESITYAFTFAPNAEGAAQATLTFDQVSDPDVDSLQFTLTGTGTQANARFGNPSLALGRVGVGTTGSGSLTLSNEGTASFTVTDVSITGADSGAFNVSGLSAGTTITDGGSHQLTVKATPTIRDSLSATLEVDTDTAGTVTSALGVTGVGPDIQIDQSSLSFGETRLGNTSDRTLQVNNTGNAPLEVSSLTVSGPANSQFVPVTTSVVVPPKSSDQLQIRYAPTTTQRDVSLAHQATERTATLTVASNDTDTAEQSLDVSLAGTGITPAFNTSSNALKYGQVIVNSTTTRTVTLENELDGTANFRITDVAIEGRDRTSYSFPSKPIGTVLEPGDSTTLSVSLNPQTSGPKYATLKIYTNDTRQDTRAVFLSNRDTLVTVTFGSVIINYTDPVQGLQPEADVARNLNTDAELQTFQIGTTQQTNFGVVLDSSTQAFDNAEDTPRFESIRYVRTKTSNFDDTAFDNATFTFRVRKAALSARSAPRGAAVFYHYDGSDYVPLPTSFDNETRTEYVYSATTTDFSEFSIGSALPWVTGASLSDTSVQTGTTIEVDVTLGNDGRSSQSITLDLQVDGSTEETRTVSVPPGGTSTTFDLSFSETGTYTVSVDGTTAGTVEVSSGGGGGGDGGGQQPTPAETPTPTPTPAGTPTPTETPTPTPTPTETPEETPTPTETPPTPTETPTATPTETPDDDDGDGGGGGGGGRAQRTPTATATAAPTLTLTAVPTATPGATPTVAATPIPAENIAGTFRQSIADADPDTPGTTVRFEDETSSVREITFDAEGVEGEVSVSELREVPADLRDAGDSGEVVHAVDITVPEEHAGSGATLTMRLSNDRLGGADPAAVRIVHRGGGTWRALETELVSAGDDGVTVRARVDQFSLFGFAFAQAQTATPTAQPTPTRAPTPTAAPPTTTEPVEEPAGFDVPTIVLIILVIVAIVVAFAVARRRW